MRNLAAVLAGVLFLAFVSVAQTDPVTEFDVAMKSLPVLSVVKNKPLDQKQKMEIAEMERLGVQAVTYSKPGRDRLDFMLHYSQYANARQELKRGLSRELLKCVPDIDVGSVSDLLLNRVRDDMKSVPDYAAVFTLIKEAVEEYLNGNLNMKDLYACNRFLKECDFWDCAYLLDSKTPPTT